MVVTLMLWLPSSKIPQSINSFDDWLIHGGIMGVAVALWCFAVIRNKKVLMLSYYVQVLLFFIAYSVLTEVVQEILIPGRTGSVLDVLANMTGVLAVLIFVYIRQKSLRNNN